MTTSRVLRAAALGALLAGTAPAARAQGDETLGSLLEAAQRAAGRAELATQDPGTQRTLDSLVAVLRTLHATELHLADVRNVIVGRDPGVLVIARLRSNRFGVAGSRDVADAVRGVRQIVNVYIAPRLQLPREARDSLLAPFDELGTLVRQGADSLDRERLRQFEIKYGPDSPRLNWPEVAANYVGQLVLPCRSLYPFPCFGVTPAGMPSPYELVLTYRSTDITRSDTGGTDGTRFRLVSTGQVGLRVYNFAPGVGEGNLVTRIVRPRHLALGAFALAARDAPLLNPLARGRRLGGFAEWGGLHAGFTTGEGARLVIGTGNQILRTLF